jgi:hypothetical protein
VVAIATRSALCSAGAPGGRNSRRHDGIEDKAGER